MPDEFAPLEASQEKVNRARSKFEYLKTLTKSYLEASGMKPRGHWHEGDLYAIVSVSSLPPAEIAWETVEAVGHLRSALDKLTVDLVDKNGRGTSGVGFPFGGMENGRPVPFPDRRLENGIMKKLTPDQWSLLAGFKPYPGGDDTLWAINEIANADKHRKGLVRVRSLVSPSDIKMKGPTPQKGVQFAGLEFCPPSGEALLADKDRETILFIVRKLSADANVICNKIQGSVVFGDLAPVAGRGVLETLDKQIKLVDGLVTITKERFF